MWSKTKHPNHDKTRKQSVTKNAKAQQCGAGYKSQGLPGSERVQASRCVVPGRPKTKLVEQPKHQKVLETNFKTLVLTTPSKQKLVDPLWISPGLESPHLPRRQELEKSDEEGRQRQLHVRNKGERSEGERDEFNQKLRRRVMS